MTDTRHCLYRGLTQSQQQTLHTQNESFRLFLQINHAINQRKSEGLQQLLDRMPPITSESKDTTIEAQGYYCAQPVFTEHQCYHHHLTYSIAVYIVLQFTKLHSISSKQTRTVLVFLGDMPLLTKTGLFIINGTFKVPIPQLKKAPGLYIDHQHQLCSVTIAPLEGEWVSLYLDTSRTIKLRIDNAASRPVTQLISFNAFSCEMLSRHVVVVTRTRLFTAIANLAMMEWQTNYNRFLHQHIIRFTCCAGSKHHHLNNKVLKPHHMQLILQLGLSGVILIPLGFDVTTELMKRSTANNWLNPAKTVNQRTETGSVVFCSSYMLSDLGRQNVNYQFHQFGLCNTTTQTNHFHPSDAVGMILMLSNNYVQTERSSDVDDLSCKRLVFVGELLKHYLTPSFDKLHKMLTAAANRCRGNTFSELEPTYLHHIQTALRSFYTNTCFLQPLENTNSLAAASHKRRVAFASSQQKHQTHTALGIRDVHHSFYSRLCPIETPEGHNIGLVNSLASCALVDELGLIRAPFICGQDLWQQTMYLTASEENQFVTTAEFYNKPYEGMVRSKKEIQPFTNQQIHFVDAFTYQPVSIGAALIPFLKHDDVNRALMGSNMQRQSVCCVKHERPLVGTGYERLAALTEPGILRANQAGKIVYADSQQVVVQGVSKHEDYTNIPVPETYLLAEPTSTNNEVQANTVVASAPSFCDEDLSLGCNVLAAFMPWHGFNFEDSIVISDRLAVSNVYSSFHMDEVVVSIKSNKILEEHTTNTIDCIKHTTLAKDGIVTIGTRIKPGDILVGKIACYKQTTTNPKEVLLEAVMCHTTIPSRDASVRASVDMNGIVTQTRVYEDSTNIVKRGDVMNVAAQTKLIELRMLQRLNCICRHHGQQSLRAVDPYKWFSMCSNLAYAKDIYQTMLNQTDEVYDNDVETSIEDQEDEVLPEGITKLVKITIAVERTLQPGDKMAGRHGNKGVVSKIAVTSTMPYVQTGQAVDLILNPLGVPSRMNLGQIYETQLGAIAWQINLRFERLSSITTKQQTNFARDMLYHFYCRTVMVEDSSIMQAAVVWKQISLLQTKTYFAVAAFSHVPLSNLARLTDFALPFRTRRAQASTEHYGQFKLKDGETGSSFVYPSTCGFIYFMKLHHLVDDKIHARSTGPYSVVTQQPLGGKAQSGGQRLGEMEVWALEAYGAAFTLHEMLTVKSDDMWGRVKIHQSILNGKPKLVSGVPESFKVLLFELKALGIAVDF